ncbi:hypothetical protein BRADI_2g02673v3 [Brachypodium distachyon]|uniref:Uncharacterized protein n=1 Tax=Brachypodium distachyon TaxID=15368 RepID=A0A0Q3IQQ2_BRADI|nr:hypothetical protein BRADI_2g02673v3 [Brachypodium distachyon]
MDMNYLGQITREQDGTHPAVTLGGSQTWRGRRLTMPAIFVAESRTPLCARAAVTTDSHPRTRRRVLLADRAAAVLFPRRRYPLLAPSFSSQTLPSPSSAHADICSEEMKLDDKLNESPIYAACILITNHDGRNQQELGNMRSWAETLLRREVRVLAGAVALAEGGAAALVAQRRHGSVHSDFSADEAEQIRFTSPSSPFFLAVGLQITVLPLSVDTSSGATPCI